MVTLLCVSWQAKRAVQRGATAVIFDVSENPDAIDQVCTHLELPRHSALLATRQLSNLSVCEKTSLLFTSKGSSAARPALPDCRCVRAVCANNDLSMYSCAEKRADQPRSFIRPRPFSCRARLLEERTENGYPGSAFTRP